MTEEEILLRQKQIDDLAENWRERAVKARGEREWWCIKCNEVHQFKNTYVYHSQHYVRPYSCNGGDHWIINDDEFYLQCDHCNTVNRMMFHSYRNEETYTSESSCKEFMKRYRLSFKGIKCIKGEWCERRAIRSINNSFMEDWDNFKYYVPDYDHPWEGKPPKLKEASPEYLARLKDAIGDLPAQPWPPRVFLKDICEY